MSGGLFWYPSVKTIATLRGSVDGCSCCWPRFSPPPIEVRLRGVSVFAPVLMAVCCVVSKAARGVRTAKASSNCTEPISKPVEGITRSANIPTADCSAVIRVPPDTAVAILPERSNTSSIAAGETGTPLPVSGTEMLGFAGSLLVIVNVPLAVPAAAGANTTVKLCDVPGRNCGVESYIVRRHSRRVARRQNEIGTSHRERRIEHLARAGVRDIHRDADEILQWHSAKVDGGGRNRDGRWGFRRAGAAQRDAGGWLRRVIGLEGQRAARRTGGARRETDMDVARSAGRYRSATRRNSR